MKTETLKKKVYKYNIYSEGENNSVKFFDIITKEPVAAIYRDKMYAFTLCKRFDDYPAEIQEALFEIFCEYVKTPLDLREEEKAEDKVYILYSYIEGRPLLATPDLNGFVRRIGWMRFEDMKNFRVEHLPREEMIKKYFKGIEE